MAKKKSTSTSPVSKDATSKVTAPKINRRSSLNKTAAPPLEAANVPPQRKPGVTEGQRLDKVPVTKPISPFAEWTFENSTEPEVALRSPTPSVTRIAGYRSVNFTRSQTFGPAERAQLRRHAINLSAGQFSTSGQFQTAAHDVKAIFGEFIPQWIEQRSASTPPQILLFAHGGLVSEQDGIETALHYSNFWLENDIYPVYFIWETGFLESIQQLWSGQTRAQRELGASRGLFAEAQDRAWEELSRGAGVKSLWRGIKQSAQLTFLADGAGLLVVTQLKTLLEQNSKIQLNVVGHSAGSIFWAHGLPTLAQAGVKVNGLYLLAPAITNDLFQKKLLGMVNQNGAVKHCTLFTMLKEFELDDQVGPYQKSLLYLVHHALEDQRDTPILGLEASLRADATLATTFGLGTMVNHPNLDIVWSVTGQDSGRSASHATTHGGFDNDPATLESIVRRIKNLIDSDQVIRLASQPSRQVAPMFGATHFTDERPQGEPLMASRLYSCDSSRSPMLDRDIARTESKKRALCIGIDHYPVAQDWLGGCVNDASAWAKWFGSQGFAVDMLVDEQATRRGIIEAMDNLISNSQSGDVIAIQMSCHGTQVEDFSADEIDDGLDEAVVPYDHRTEGYIVDDNIGELVDKLPAGVSLNFFMDLCHSGTATRFLIGTADDLRGGVKVRFLRADKQMNAAHERTASRASNDRRAAYEKRPEILFAACAPDQTAKERDGHGDFTRYALQVLTQNLQGLTNASFMDAVNRAGSFDNQDPKLWCDSHLQTNPFLGAGNRNSQVPGANRPQRNQEFADAIRDVESALSRLRRFA